MVQGNYDEAVPLYERAITINEKTLGPEHPSLASMRINLAGSLQAQVRLLVPIWRSLKMAQGKGKNAFIPAGLVLCALGLVCGARVFGFWT